MQWVQDLYRENGLQGDNTFTSIRTRSGSDDMSLVELDATGNALASVQDFAQSQREFESGQDMRFRRVRDGRDGRRGRDGGGHQTAGLGPNNLATPLDSSALLPMDDRSHRATMASYYRGVANQARENEAAANQAAAREAAALQAQINQAPPSERQAIEEGIQEGFRTEARRAEVIRIAQRHQITRELEQLREVDRLRGLDRLREVDRREQPADRFTSMLTDSFDDMQRLEQQDHQDRMEFHRQMENNATFHDRLRRNGLALAQDGHIVNADDGPMGMSQDVLPPLVGPLDRHDPYSVRYPQPFNNGLGDRDRSPSPEGEVTWDIIQSTLTPDPQPLSAGSSFTQTTGYAPASESNAASASQSQSQTPATTPGEGPEPCDPVADETEAEDRDPDRLLARLPIPAALRGRLANLRELRHSTDQLEMGTRLLADPSRSRPTRSMPWEGGAEQQRDEEQQSEEEQSDEEQSDDEESEEEQSDDE